MEELKRVQRKDRIELNELDQDECSSSRKIPKHEVSSDEDDNELPDERAKEIPSMTNNVMYFVFLLCNTFVY